MVETLIPVTIILTCLYNIIRKPLSKDGNTVNYLMALGFGLIHGLGFANFFKALADEAESIILPLFYFNVGVELGQIIVVLLTLAAGSIVVDFFKAKQKYWNYTISGIILVWALKMIFF